MKKNLLVSIICILYFSFPNFSSHIVSATEFSSEVIDVSLPDFNITINGVTVDNSRLKLPFIVYNDIVYTPYCQPLGFEKMMFLSDNKDSGITLVKNFEINPEVRDMSIYYGEQFDINEMEFHKQQDYVYALDYEPFGKLNIKKHTAPVNYAIDISEYPVLFMSHLDSSQSYHIYYPLTYEIIADNMGCNYSFDQENGLVINYVETPFEDIFKVANYPIELNGKEYDNEKAEVKFINYGGVTYMPVTYKMCSFMGLVISDYTNGKTGLSRFSVGNTNITSDEHSVPMKKTSEYVIVQGDLELFGNSGYDFALNDTDGKSNVESFNRLDYSPFRLKNIWYIPLTYDVITELGWQLSFDETYGLTVDSRNTYKADYGIIVRNTSDRLNPGFSGGQVRYYVFESDGYYVITESRSSGSKLYIGKKGREEEIIFEFSSIRDKLTKATSISQDCGKFKENRFILNLKYYEIVFDLDTGELVSIIEKDNSVIK